MNLLFIESFLTGDYPTLRYRLAIICLMWIAVGIAIGVDLVSGYRKAKERKEARTSFGLRRTIDKAVRYYSLMIIAFLFDCIITFFFPHPVATFIFAAFIFFVEGKSIYEKAHEKDKRRMMESAKDISVLLQNKDDLLKGINELLDNKLKENEENQETNE